MARRSTRVDVIADWLDGCRLTSPRGEPHRFGTACARRTSTTPSGGANGANAHDPRTAKCAYCRRRLRPIATIATGGIGAASATATRRAVRSGHPCPRARRGTEARGGADRLEPRWTSAIARCERSTEAAFLHRQRVSWPGNRHVKVSVSVATPTRHCSAAVQVHEKANTNGASAPSRATRLRPRGVLEPVVLTNDVPGHPASAAAAAAAAATAAVATATAAAAALPARLDANKDAPSEPRGAAAHAAGRARRQRARRQV